MHLSPPCARQRWQEPIDTEFLGRDDRCARLVVDALEPAGGAFSPITLEADDRSDHLHLHLNCLKENS